MKYEITYCIIGTPGIITEYHHSRDEFLAATKDQSVKVLVSEIPGGAIPDTTAKL